MDRLQAYALKLKRFIDGLEVGEQQGAGPPASEDLPPMRDIAYTLQAGREFMAARLAMIAGDLKTLKTRLERFTGSPELCLENEGIYTNTVPTSDQTYGRDQGPVDLFTDSDLGRELVDLMVQRRDLHKIAQLWISGMSIDWRALYQAPMPDTVPLPTYPFERARHWVQSTALHPHAPLPERQQTLQASAVQSTPMKKTASEKTGRAMIEAYISKMAARELQIAPRAIKPGQDLREYGLDSIGSLRLVNQLKSHYGCEIPIEVLSLVSVRTLADAVVASHVASAPDLEEEAIDKRDLFPDSRRMDPLLETGTILLNGATGVLGGHLLKELLETTQSNVVCLVRASDQTSARERLREFLKTYDTKDRLGGAFDNRVSLAIGDITKPHLGMDLQTYQTLAGKIDLVIHNAGKTSLHGVYSELQAVNVQGTQAMIDFTLATAQKYLIFISSYTVLGDRIAIKMRPFTEQDLDVGQGFSNLGYPRSKFEAETLVRTAHQQGLRWIIVRPGNIMGESHSGAYPFGLTSTPGIFYDLLKTVIDLKIAPSSKQLFDITPVDYVSRSIVHLCLERQEIFSTYHLLNPDPKSFEQVAALLCDIGYSVELIDRYLFVEGLRTDLSNYHSLTAELMRFNQAFIPNSEGTRISTRLTHEVLSKGGIHCPPIDACLLKTYVDYCIRIGYLEAPENSPIRLQVREPMVNVASTKMLSGG